MAFIDDIPLMLGPGKAGLTDLRAQLVDEAGADAGDPIATGFTEDQGGGMYWWRHAFAEDSLTRVRFYSAASAGDSLGIITIDSRAGGGGGGEKDWTDIERNQIRFRLGIDGDKEEPATADPAPIVLTPAGDAQQTTIGGIVYGQDGLPAAEVPVSIRLAFAPAGVAGVFPGDVRETQSNGSGIFEFPGSWRGARYEIWSGSGGRREIRGADAATTIAPSILHVSDAA